MSDLFFLPEKQVAHRAGESGKSKVEKAAGASMDGPL